MKNVATLPKKRKTVDDICNECEYLEKCLVAYDPIAAYRCEEGK